MSKTPVDIPDDVLEDPGLIRIRKEYEAGLKPITVFIPFRETDTPNALCVVLEGPGGSDDRFHCHRYMRQLNGEWDVSLDGQGVSSRDALKWIPSPRAI